MILTTTLITPAPVVYAECDIEIGAFCVIEASQSSPVELQKGVTIRHHVVISPDLRLGPNVLIDSFCYIGKKSSIGQDSQILYGAKVFEEVVIGSRCIVGGDVANWTILRDDITFMGTVAHNYRKPHGPTQWNTGAVPSPVINNRVVVGEKAMLMGGIEIGEGAYIAATELVKCDVPPDMLFVNGKLVPLASFCGFIRSRPK